MARDPSSASDDMIPWVVVITKWSSCEPQIRHISVILNINLVAYKLNCNRDILGNNASVFTKYVTHCRKNSNNAVDSQIVGNIKDLLHLRDTKSTTFTVSETNFMLNHLCTS